MRIVTIDIGHHYPDPVWNDRHRVHDPAHVEQVASDILTDAGFDGHTITHGTGYWQGAREPQTSVRIYLTGSAFDSRAEVAIEALRVAAASIRDALRQESVAFTVHDAEVAFV